MSETTLPPTPLPLPDIADASLPLYSEYVAAAYAVVLLAMLWLALSAWRERLRLRRLAATQGKQ